MFSSRLMQFGDFLLNKYASTSSRQFFNWFCSNKKKKNINWENNGYEGLTLLSSSKCFDGYQRVYTYFSDTCSCEMIFGIYLPPVVFERGTKCPVLYFLSGLKSTPLTFIEKSGMQRYAAELGLIIVSPDSSPRNVDIPGQNTEREVGAGASFYLDACRAPWCKHYQMHSWITKELIDVVNINFPAIPDKQSICGMSMGGHGALLLVLKNPGLYKSVSAFAPLTNISECRIGKKVLSTYIGTDRKEWQQWDPTCLAKTYNGRAMEILIDQGTDDVYLDELMPENFINAAKGNDCLNVIFNQREGYDHSSRFYATFMEDHFKYHNCHLRAEH